MSQHFWRNLSKMSKPVKRKNEFWKEYFKRLRIYNSDYEKSIRRGKRILSKWRKK